MAKPILVIGLPGSTNIMEARKWQKDLDTQQLSEYQIIIYMNHQIHKPEFQLLPEGSELPSDIQAMIDAEKITAREDEVKQNNDDVIINYPTQIVDKRRGAPGHYEGRGVNYGKNTTK